MKRLFISLLFILPFFTEAQTNDKIRKGDIKQKMLNKDSVAQKIQQFKDSIAKTIDSQQAAINVQNNVNQLLEIQKENKDRRRKAAITRLAIGAAFLALLVMGLMKRRKKQG